MLTTGELAARLNKLHLSILLANHQRVEADWSPPVRTIKHHSFWLIVKGRGHFTINGTRYPAEPGKLFFFQPGMIVKRETEHEHPLEYCFVRFHYMAVYEEKEQWVTGPQEEYPFPFGGMYSVHNVPQLLGLMDQLVTLWKRRGHMNAMRRNITLHEFFLALLTDLRAQKIAGDTTAAIELTQDYMISHYKDPLTLEQLAQIAGLSVSHYSRLFKKVIGYSPIDYLNHLRMDRAKELLVLSDYRLKAIAGSVGFTDEFYFSRLFKKLVGVPPREYAKKHRLIDGGPR